MNYKSQNAGVGRYSQENRAKDSLLQTAIAEKKCEQRQSRQKNFQCYCGRKSVMGSNTQEKSVLTCSF